MPEQLGQHQCGTGACLARVAQGVDHRVKVLHLYVPGGGRGIGIAGQVGIAIARDLHAAALRVQRGDMQRHHDVLPRMAGNGGGQRYQRRTGDRGIGRGLLGQGAGQQDIVGAGYANALRIQRQRGGHSVASGTNQMQVRAMEGQFCLPAGQQAVLPCQVIAAPRAQALHDGGGGSGEIRLRASLRMVPGQGGKHDEGGHVLHVPQGLGVKARARGRDVGRVELPVLVTRKRQVIAMSGQGTGPMGLADGHANMATGCGQGGLPAPPRCRTGRRWRW
ncbi:hypothetical protein RAA17_16960 [Komagataeibacter rhaeticus]|nr:hypothetical protein [Komagataeibacter rhaeticus]